MVLPYTRVCACVGLVRGEASTRIPEPVSLTTPMTRVVECESNTTATEAQPQPSTEEEEALRHYTSYTAAIGVTVGVGCLLVLLNLLLFAGQLLCHFSLIRFC